MDREISLLDICKQFHDNMDKPGFRPLIRCASKVFDAPVVFTDNKYKLISLYPNKKIGDFVYDTLLETGELPEETIAEFHEAYLNQPGTRYQPFYEDAGLVKDCPRIFAEVYDEVEVFGHIAIFLKDKKFEPWQLEAASFLTNTLRIKINLTKQAPSVRSDSLQDLLDRNSTKQVRARAIAQLSKTYEKPTILLVAPLDQSKSQHAFASVAINYCLHKFPSSIPTIYGDDLVILLTNKKEYGDSPSIANQISNYLKQYKILCGAVSPIEDLYSLPDYYLQGRLTALYRYRDEIKNERECTPLYFYNEIAPYPLFLHLSLISEYRCFIHPVIEEIKEYDKNNGTDFYNTLSSYCKNLFQKNDTAEDLHIHRNTLNYRLNRAEELFNIDLNDFQTLLHILISIEIKSFDKS